jgi:addiction module RelE/StbE family toxin
MDIIFHRNFKKQYKKLRLSDRKMFAERLDLFKRNPFNPILNNHQLYGKYKDYMSINIRGNLRALYEPVGKNIAHFMYIDTHPNLYG